VNVPRNGTGVIEIELLNITTDTEVRVIVPDGQVTVSPTSWSANPNDRKKQFNVRVKKQSREIKFSSGCGVAVVRVNVA
jgi:YbbR domain-containing protein